MAAETDFLNDALGQIGATRISGIDDGTENANHCLTFWPPLRKALLRSHHWNFAEARASLALNVTAPAFEFAFSYALPTDLLKLKSYNSYAVNVYNFDDPGPWMFTQFKVEGRNLYTNDGSVLIVYVKDVPDPNQWDALFYQAASTWLASKLALAIPKDAKMSANLLTMATGMLLPLALAADGQEGPIQPLQSNDLIWGR